MAPKKSTAANEQQTAANEQQTAANEQQTTANEQQTSTTQTDAAAEAEKILEDAKAKAAEIIARAEAEAKAAVKAAKEAAKEETVKEAAVPSGEELVAVRLFKDNDRYKDDVFVAVNGERVQIKRGETVMVKRKFAAVLEQSMAQDTATANLIEEESSRYEAEAKARNL